MRKNTQIRTLLDASDRAQYLSPQRLTTLLGVTLPYVTVERLANRFPTLEDWAAADPILIGDILGDAERDLAQPILTRVLRTRL